jgi:hypothetical protein
MRKLLAVVLTLALALSAVVVASSNAFAATVKNVVLVGNLQSELGGTDWDPASTATKMVSADGVNYWFTGTLPAGDYEYKVAYDGGWTENYGKDGKAGGDNITLSLATDRTITFFYSDTTHRFTLSKHVALVGNLQSELNGTDWDPATTATQMSTVDGVNYFFVGTLPAGSYEYKVALNGGWGENYGKDGKSGGDNIAITVPADGKYTFAYNDTTHKITVGGQVALVGDIQQAIGAANNWDPATTTTVMLPQGNGTYVYQTSVPAGSYEYKVALNGNWDVSYGDGSNNARLTVAKAGLYKFTFNETSHAITVEQVLLKKVFPKSIKFKFANIILRSGFRYKTAIVTTPALVSEKYFKFSSSNTKVATIDYSGKIRAVGEGTATITAIGPNKTKATMTVRVIK